MACKTLLFWALFCVVGQLLPMDPFSTGSLSVKKIPPYFQKQENKQVVLYINLDGFAPEIRGKYKESGKFFYCLADADDKDYVYEEIESILNRFNPEEISESKYLEYKKLAGDTLDEDEISVLRKEEACELAKAAAVAIQVREQLLSGSPSEGAAGSSGLSSASGAACSAVLPSSTSAPTQEEIDSAWAWMRERYPSNSTSMIGSARALGFLSPLNTESDPFSLTVLENATSLPLCSSSPSSASSVSSPAHSFFPERRVPVTERSTAVVAGSAGMSCSAALPSSTSAPHSIGTAGFAVPSVSASQPCPTAPHASSSTYSVSMSSPSIVTSVASGSSSGLPDVSTRVQTWSTRAVLAWSLFGGGNLHSIAE